MERFVRGFIRASLIWFLIGGLLGLAMAYAPMRMAVVRPAHVHANLLGFVSMMIFGVAYHVLPRFTGVPLHSRRLPVLHLWLGNLGVAALVGGWIVRVLSAAAGNLLVGAGAAFSGVGGALFVYNLWRTLDGSALRRGVLATRT